MAISGIMKKFFLIIAMSILSSLYLSGCLVNDDKPFKNVLLIGWDGVEREHLYDLLNEFKLKNLQKIIDEGAIVNITATTGKTQTKPGWSEILSGYSPTITGVYSNREYKPIPRGYTIFERLEDHFGKDNIVTMFIGGKINNIGARGKHKICVNCLSRDASHEKTYWWLGNTTAPTTGGSERIFEERDGEPYYYAKESLDVYSVGFGNGSNVFSKAIEYLEDYKDEMLFMFIHFEEPDELGHKHGGFSANYIHGMIKDDYWLGGIISKLKELKIYDETLIYVVSDHGFNIEGYDHWNSPYIFMATNDKAVKINGDRKDIAPTILSRYGFNLEEISPKLEGVPLVGFAKTTPSNFTSKEEMNIGYFHGGRIFIPYRSYVFGEFDNVGINVRFHTVIGDKEPQELVYVPKSALEVKKIRGVTPTFGRMTGREILHYMMEGQLDGGTIGESSFIEAAEMGLPIVAVAELGHDTMETNGKSILVRKGSGIKKPEDFIGKNILSRQAGPGDATFLREFFISIGIDIDQVNIIDQVAPSQIEAKLWDGEVDGGYYHHMSVENLVKKGVAEIYQPFNWTNPKLSQAVLVYRKDYYESHQEEIKKFLEVYSDRIKYEQDNPVEVYYKQDGVEERGLRAHLKFAGMDIPRFSYPPLINITLLNQMQDLLQKHGQVDYPPVDLNPYINQTLLQELIN